MRISARELLGQLLDAHSFVSWDHPPLPIDASARYREDLRKAEVSAGTDESVLTGEGLLRGRRVAVIACEFGFLAGSIGVAAAERIVTAVERATESGLPLIASPTSGGTRMQEGTVAFVQMVKIAGAVAEHKSAGNPYLVYLRNPTMGGVFASWGSLGHITFAEPGALIGFLGPRVYKALYKSDFPEGVQTAENLYHKGVIDGVLPIPVFRRIAHRALSIFTGTPLPDTTPHRPNPQPPAQPKRIPEPPNPAPLTPHHRPTTTTPNSDLPTHPVPPMPPPPSDTPRATTHGIPQTRNIPTPPSPVGSEPDERRFAAVSRPSGRDDATQEQVSTAG
ncbi:acetyl-CoA carboxylase carboxyltransferase subunit beta, partial [Nocardia bovistercoris]|uniref:acetyl-CoA carboxylase carboxyltransferase subunit beta n=1 Tax=Nocardia bovistercoris TaxID=2785916 RepID=UPI0022B76E1A